MRYCVCVSYSGGGSLAPYAKERGICLQEPVFRVLGGDIREVLDYIVHDSKFSRESIGGSGNRAGKCVDAGMNYLVE